MMARRATREDTTESMPVTPGVPIAAHRYRHPYDTTICQYDELTCRKDFEVPETLRRMQTVLPHSPRALHHGFSS
jgi:hypothetical protein